MLNISRFKAAILTEQNCPLILDQISLPNQLEYGQVLVKVVYSGVCGSQVGEIDGVKGPDRFLPHLLGHEGGGVVVATGPGVVHVKENDHVVMHWRPGSGIESPVPQYQWNQKLVNAGWVTTFNEYAVVSENRVTAIPKDFPLDVAALLGCAVLTGLGVISRDAMLTLGESIVVIGAGGVGLNVIQGAALVSADPIIAVDIRPEKLEMARRFGATHCCSIDEVASILGDQGADCVVESTGHVELMERAYELTSNQGRCIFVGVPKEKRHPAFYSLPLHFGKTITGSHGGSSHPGRDIPRYIRMSESGKLHLQGLITDRLSLDDVNEAIERVREGQVLGRCVIEMGGKR